MVPKSVSHIAILCQTQFLPVLLDSRCIYLSQNMANSSLVPIACMKIGSSPTNLSCCYPDDQTNPICDAIFTPQNNFLQTGCPGPDCAGGCSDVKQIYASRLEENLTGNGNLPIARYMACANLPSISTYASQKVLSSNIADAIGQYIVPNVSTSSLGNVTSAVTDCLSSTCRQSRNSSACYDNYCSPVKLLRNDTSPNLENINACLYQLCSNPVEALPWADADVIGVGVGKFEAHSQSQMTISDIQVLKSRSLRPTLCRWHLLLSSGLVALGLPYIRIKRTPLKRHQKR